MDEAWGVDWVNECLWHGETMVRLPPKIFAVLRLLVGQAGQLVTKEVLLQAVWPETVVSEAVLTTCIGELRKALGETAQAPRFIQTVHRRGYRFIGHLATIDPAALPRLPASHPGGTVHLPPLVGREREFTHLHEWLERVRQGARQIVFLTGEPGLGKTTVVNAFVEDVVGAGDVWLARGQCIDHFGRGEAYLPVLEALGRLCREPEGAALLPVLEQHAPTWLAQMPALLSATMVEAVQRRVVGATQQRMLRELAETVEVLTASRPLLLVLEDLHWSDYATLDLLTYLARRLGRSRLLVLGTYRPVEVLLRRHPLQTVKQELVLHGQAVELPLELLTAAHVGQYLALRCAGGADLPPPIRRLAQIMYQRTDGHPLFMATTVEHLLDCGVLRDVAGRWEVQPEAAAAVLEVPTSVRQMIEQQFERLSPEEQRVLEVASVVGASCAVAAVAAGLDLAMEAVENCCAGLAQRGQFLVASGIEAWPDGTATERYAWRHSLYQEVVYAQVPEGRRLRLHRCIGTREEAGYGEQARAHAAELAVHFERGQDTSRAVRYMQKAADNALWRYACQEASDWLRRGLALLTTLPETPARVQQELEMQLALGPALIATKGPAGPDVEHTYTRARTLCAQVGETPKLFQALRGLWSCYFNRGALPGARELGEELFGLAQRAAVPTQLLDAHQALGMTLFFLGDYVSAHTHCVQGMTLIDPAAQRAQALYQDAAPAVRCLVTEANTLWCIGYPTQAMRRLQEALALAQALAHPHGLAFAQQWAAVLHHRHREVPAVQAQAEALLALAIAQGFPLFAALGTFWRGWALAMQGQGEAALAQMRQGMAAALDTGTELARPFCLVPFAEAAGHAGQFEEGLRLLTEALTEIEASGQGSLLAEAYRLQGAFLLRQADAVRAEACYQQALTVARRQQAKSWELRAAMSLGRLWLQQGKRTEAHHLLAQVYGWFTEGFNTVDLQEADALLNEWGNSESARRSHSGRPARSLAGRRPP
jgi:DNA-binding winged helix-turn-helix (wHTH) protein/predicted ATPase